jgi:hypothetical protein
MKTFLKAMRLWIFGMVSGLYTAFVLQSLWNWFVAPTLNVTQISYWQMYGFNMLLQMVLARSDFVENDHWNRTATMLHACVKAERREDVDEELRGENESVWSKAGTDVFGKLVGNTVTLLIGFAIHVFLV